MNNDIYNVIPTPHWDSVRKCMRIDLHKDGRLKTFRSDRTSTDGKPLTKKQMKANVTEKVRTWDWTVTGNPRLTVESAFPDWCTYLGWTVTPKKGPQNQNWNTISAAVEETLVVRSTFEQYYRLFKVHSIPVIGDKRIGDVDPDDIQDIIDRMAARRNYDRDTMKGVLKATKAFFEWQRRICKAIMSNPCIDITIKDIQTTRERRAGEPEEIERIFYEMELSHVVHAIMFCLHTGMRPEEVCGMPEDHDYSKGYVMEQVVTQFGEVRDRGKSRKATRNVPLGEYALIDIKNQREMKRRKGIKSPWLFCNVYGRALTPKVMSDIFRKYADRAGSNLSLYELRHTMLSIMTDDVSEKALKDGVGHSESMRTSEIYGHALRAEKAKLPNQIDKSFDKFYGQSKRNTRKIIPFQKNI